MSRKRKILIVEDNDINRAILSEILDEHYEVLEAENGRSALDVVAVHKDSISLILLDIQMPVMDGLEFLSHIEDCEQYSHIPVIVMTQKDSEDDELAALEHGATDFLPKPYKPQIILHRVAGLIKLRETSAMINQLQYDRLTGLYTKEYFFERVKQQLMEDSDSEYSIVCSNVENFKLVNDIFGTSEGDKLLREVAEITQEMIGDDGICCRFNADRFISLQKREAEIKNREKYEDGDFTSTSSLLKNFVMRWGIYEIDDNSVTVEQMCDRAMLAADSIKNQYLKYYALYDDSLRSKLLREQAITSAMDKAIEDEEFVVYYQPKYSLDGDRVAGAEALVRWIHPEWGFMSPGEFIPLFEKNGFVQKLDQYVRRKVCEQLKDWKDRGVPLVPVSVNISRADVFQNDLPLAISSLVNKYDVEPKYLHLEITESAYTEKPDLIVGAVESLRKIGFVVEMDDFGSGYSSLNMLSQMSLDILKLDMAFVRNELAKNENRSILGSVIEMAHQVDMSVVAEGVEDAEQVERLRTLSCDYVQGFYFAKPMPAAEYEALLLKEGSTL